MATNSEVKHNVFLSFYHADDEGYRERFEELFGDLCINRWVHPGDINTENSDDYVKSLIRRDYIRGSSVVVVLVGAKTYCRKHVDWEMYAGLDEAADGYSGLLGLMLPTHPSYRNRYSNRKYKPESVPRRLMDNISSDMLTFTIGLPIEMKSKNTSDTHLRLE